MKIKILRCYFKIGIVILINLFLLHDSIAVCSKAAVQRFIPGGKATHPAKQETVRYGAIELCKYKIIKHSKVQTPSSYKKKQALRDR